MIERPYYYKLQGREVVACGGCVEWAFWFEQSRDRFLFKTSVNSRVLVSTVFTGLDPGWGERPHVFETLVFGGRRHGCGRRAATWEEAEETHAAIVEETMRAERTPRRWRVRVRERARRQIFMRTFAAVKVELQNIYAKGGA